MDRVPAVLTEFCALYRKYGRPITTGLKASSRQHVETYLKWCDANEVDPILFMRDRFRRVALASKGYLPGFRNLASEKLLAAWKTGESRAHREAADARLTREAASTASRQHFDSLRAPPRPAQEQYKRTYVLSGRPELCRLSSQHSGGYHPKSSVCPTCPQAVRCAQDLNAQHGFDLVSVRAAS